MFTGNQFLKNLSSKVRHWIVEPSCMIALGISVNSPCALADGTDMLEPTSATLADGSAIIGAGTGLSLVQPGDIEIEIPAAASVEQVLIYWDGADRDYTGVPPTIGVTSDTIDVSGNAVEGVFIGGRTFGTDVQQFTFRADITSLGLVSPGSNTLLVSGLEFGSESVETGAGVMVIVDEGTSSTLRILDGSDYAYIGCTEDFNCQETVKRMFTFPASSSARDAELTMFFTSVSGTASTGNFRPSVVRVWVGGESPIEIVNELDSVDGEEWDTLNIEFEVPSGVTQVEVQAFSENLNLTPDDPASFKWLAAALSVPDELPGGYGCTPGYWKQGHHFPDWTAPYDPEDPFADHFEDAFPGRTLVDVLDGNGGGLTALGRHTVAALLNAANPEVSYDLSSQQVIDAFNDVYPGTKDDYEGLKNYLEGLNEQGCPLNNSDGSNNGNGNGNRSNGNGPTGTEAVSASLSDPSGGGGALGFWEVVAFLALGYGMLVRERRRLSFQEEPPVHSVRQHAKQGHASVLYWCPGPDSNRHVLADSGF